MTLLAVKYVKTNRRLGGKSVYVALHNPTIRAQRVNGKIVAYAGGEPISRKEAAKQFRTLGFPLLAKIVSPDATPEDLLNIVIAGKGKCHLYRDADVKCYLSFSFQIYREAIDLVQAAIQNLRSKNIDEATIMKAAAESDEPKVRFIAANSPATPEKSLFKLLKNEEEDHVALQALRNLEKRGADRTEIMRAAAESPRLYIQSLAAKSPDTPAACLLKLIRSNDPIIYEGATENLRRKGICTKGSRQGEGGIDFGYFSLDPSNPFDEYQDAIISLERENSEFTALLAKLEHLLKSGKHIEIENFTKDPWTKYAQKLVWAMVISPHTPTELLWRIIELEGLEISYKVKLIDDDVLDAEPADSEGDLGKGFTLSQAELEAVLKSPLPSRRKALYKAGRKGMVYVKSDKGLYYKWSPFQRKSLFITPLEVKAAIENLSRREFPEAEFRAMAESPSQIKRLVVAKSSATPNELLFDFLFDEDSDVNNAALRTILGLIR